MSLQEEIDLKVKEISTDGYPMSIGEIISLYKDGEIDIHPEFQRFYRWTSEQKSRLIESILLGIPIPSIFVAQREDGVWDVIDGLQRLSTILEFVGELKNENEEKMSPLKPIGTTYLPSLAGKLWEDDDAEYCLTNAQRLSFKRQKLDIKIIRKESDPETKYELFQRLNTGGTPLSEQEIRNCILIMLNKEFYSWLRTLSEYEPFIQAVCLSEKLLEEQYDLELILRFFAYKNTAQNDIEKIRDVKGFLTEKMVEFCSPGNTFNLKAEKEGFESTFRILEDILGEDVFKRYCHEKKKFTGAFLISAFEVIAVGVGYNLENGVSENKIKAELANKVKNLWGMEEFRGNSGSGTNVRMRLPKLLPLGIELFKYED